jgi:hypothetical protein
MDLCLCKYTSKPCPRCIVVFNLSPDFAPRSHTLLALNAQAEARLPETLRVMNHVRWNKSFEEK